MESNASLADLYSYFDQKLEALLISLAIKKNPSQEWSETLIESIFSQMSSLKINLSLIRNKLNEQKNALEKATIIKSKLQSTLEVANYAKANIIQHLPKKNSPPQVDVSDMESLSVKPPLGQDSALQCGIQSSTSEKKPLEKKPPATSVSHDDEFSKNYINYLTVAEFEFVPKYMKGRLTYNQINSYIDGMDKTFEIKYKLMHQKKSTLTEKKKQLYSAYKSQENALSQGFPFIVDADLKEHTRFRMDSILRSIIVILRHCGRIKEIRGGGLTRYAISAAY